MNRRAVTYLQTLGIDVWVPRQSDKHVRSETSPATSVVQPETLIEQPVKPAREESTNARPSSSSSIVNTPTQNKVNQIKMRVEQIGDVAIVYGEPIPQTVRIAKDIAFFINDYESKRVITDDWNWPPFGLANEESLTEPTRRGFSVWLSERIQKKRLLIVCQGETVDQLVTDLSGDATKLKLDEQAFKKDGKKRIWSQLESLMT